MRITSEALTMFELKNQVLSSAGGGAGSRFESNGLRGQCGRSRCLRHMTMSLSNEAKNSCSLVTAHL